MISGCYFIFYYDDCELSIIVSKSNVELPGMAITIAKGHEPRLYEALYVIAGPFLKFTTVKL